MRVGPLSILIAAVSWGGTALGTWQMIASKSTFAGDIQPKRLIVRIEEHAKGEVFTLDRTEADGRNTSASTILYFDGEPRRFQDFGCSGIQSSRRADTHTVEILRMCASGAWIRFIRRPGPVPREMVLEITEQESDGRRVERRLVLEKTITRGKR